jgi:predicted Zn-dependent peptidase
VAGFGKADLAAFVGERYGPEQIILSAAGAVNPERLLRAAERLFGGLAAGPRLEIPAARFAGGDRRESRDLEQVHVAMGFEGPAVRADAAYAAQLYSVALGGGMSSRLFQELRERRGLCYTVFTQAGAYADTGLMTLYAGTGPDQIRELAEVAMDELRRAAEGLGEAEIARARAQMKAGMLMGLESPSARAERLARMLATWDRVMPLEETLARIEAVTAADLRAFGEALIGGAGPAMALLGPVGEVPSRDALARRLAA